jgi:hypothetical protein
MPFSKQCPSILLSSVAMITFSELEASTHLSHTLLIILLPLIDINGLPGNLDDLKRAGITTKNSLDI